MLNIALTIGDINGIGPEVIIKSLSKEHFNDICFTLITPNSVLQEYLKKLEIKINNQIKIIEPDCINNFPVLNIGIPTVDSGNIAFYSLKKAIEMAKLGLIDAIVTAPISKKALILAGHNFTGHTEILDSEYQSNKAQMLFVSNNLRLLLLTRHIPLNDIIDNISVDMIIKEIIDLSFNINKDFNIKNPSIALMAINPHAGESGTIGNEEDLLLIPAINHLKEKNIDINGPFPADSFWNYYNKFDCLVSIYHDQGLTPLKLLCKEKLVNLTTGLPIVRTSPCHGTAYDIAGKYIANEESFISAIYSAKEVIQNRQTKQ